jgi:undecaprenyl-diphosphatase
MPIFHAIILGLVQGLTEFLPVSSSGHLIVFPELFGWDVSSVTFDVTIHIATLLAIIVALRTDLVDLGKGMLKRDRKMMKLFWMIVVATIPAVVIGGLFSDQLEIFRSMWIVGVCLVAWGVILFLAEKYSEKLKAHVQHSEDMSWRSAMIVGCMQVLAFIPGTSRSGVTMSAGLLSGLSKETAAKFSFLLAIPAIAGAGAVTLVHVLKAGLDVPVPSLIAGFIAAFISGIFAIRFLLLLIKKWSFAPFALYRVVFGVILLIVSVLK